VTIEKPSDRVTTCPEKLEMSGNLTADKKLTKCQGKYILLGKKVYC